MKVIVSRADKKEGFSKSGNPYSGTSVRVISPEDGRTGFILYIDESIIPYDHVIIGGSYDLYLTPDGRQVVMFDPLFDVEEFLSRSAGADTAKGDN